MILRFRLVFFFCTLSLIKLIFFLLFVANFRVVVGEKSYGLRANRVHPVHIPAARQPSHAATCLEA